MLSNMPCSAGRRAPQRSSRRRVSRRTSPRSSPATTSAPTTSHDGIPLGVYCRKSLLEHLDADDILDGHQAGLRRLPRAVRLPLPVAEVRPDLRARVQRGRDGERRLRHHHRGLRLPVAHDRRRLRAPRRHGAARDGAHVVRRPRHDALVGRPVAQRVVRGVRLHPGHRRHDPLDRRLDVVLHDREDLGLPPGPAADHAPDRRGHRRHRGGDDQLRRHHLRQGRVGPQAAGRTGSASDAFFAATRAYFARARVLATPRCRTCSTPWTDASGRDLSTWSKEWLQTAGRQHAAPRVRDRRATALHVLRRRAGRARGPPDAALAPAADRPLRPHGRRPAVAQHQVELDVAGADTDVARAGRRRSSPTWCCSTTTTSPTPRSGSTSAPGTRWSTRSASSASRSPARCAGARPGT